MDTKQPKLDREGTDSSRRHARRARRAFLTLALAVLVAVGVLASTLVQYASRHAGEHEKASQQAQEFVVNDTAAPVEKAEGESEANPSQKEPSQMVEPVHVKLMMIGDVLMHQSVIDTGDNGDGTYSYDHLFSQIGDDIAEADVAVLNQETILGGSSWAYSGYPSFNSPQEVGDAEVAAGFDVVLKATNHTFDFGYDGVRAELAYWASKHPEMAVIGMADPDGDGIAPVGGTSPAGPWYYEKDGFTIAMLNYTDILNGSVEPSTDGRVVSIADEQAMRADLKAAREKADLVVVFMHWGEEYENEPTGDERMWEGILFDCGVDVVIGGHPHVIQPVEVIDDGKRKMLVCWSVGNFVSTQLGAANMVGGMVKLSLVKDGDGARVESYEFIPTVTQRVLDWHGICAYKLSDYTDELAAASSVSAVDGGNGATRQWYVDYCANVLGEGFDTETLSVHGKL